MRLTIILIIQLVITTFAGGQGLLKGENGKVKFFSDAPLEDIEAESKKVTSAFNTSTGDIAVLIPIKSFVFEKSLMQEHFNENYLESDKYADATFVGKMTEKHFSAKPGEIRRTSASGKLTIHGVTLQRDIPMTLKADSDGSVVATGKFMVKVADHKIRIPRLVFQNIAEEVEVSFELKLRTKGV